MSILKTRWIWFGIFLALLVVSVAALVTWKLKPGIDFVGGTLVEYRYQQPTSVETVRSALATAGFGDAIVQPIDAATVQVRAGVLDQALQTQLQATLAAIGAGSERQLQSIGPTIGRDLTRKAILGVVLAIVGILLYIAWAFRRVPSPLNSWQFGTAAVLTLAHDVLFVLGLFAFLGHFRDFTVDSYFITALLTVMGFSVHDTIVVFDRIRENLLKHRSWPIEQIFDASIAQTVVRSLNTSLTAIIVLVTLLVLGGSSIRPFLVALVAGIAVGTYSSIFVATPLLPVLARIGRQPVTDRSNSADARV